MTYWVKGYRKLCLRWRRRPSVTRLQEVGCGRCRLRWLRACSCSSAAIFARIEACSLTCSHGEIAISVSGCVLPFLFGLIKGSAGHLWRQCFTSAKPCAVCNLVRGEGWDCGAMMAKAIRVFFWNWNKWNILAKISTPSSGTHTSALTRKAFRPQDGVPGRNKKCCCFLHSSQVGHSS